MVSKSKRNRRPSKAQPIALDPALEDARPTDIVIPIMGATGAGKSTFINRLLEHIGDNRPRVKVGDQLASCTFDLQSIVISNQIRGRGSRYLNLTNEYRIVLVDTPGFDDTTASDFQILRRIAKWLEESLERKMILGGVIYLHDISQDRFSGTARRNLTMFSHLCGDAALDKVTLVTSKWGRQGTRDFAKREEELKEIHWQDMLRKKPGGATVRRLDPWRPDGGEGASAWEVVSNILRQLDLRLNVRMLEEVLKIQTELVKEKKSIRETEAAKELREQLEQALRIQEEMLALEASAAEGDVEAEEKVREKEEQLREMHEVIQQNRASLFTRMASVGRRFKRFNFRWLILAP